MGELAGVSETELGPAGSRQESGEAWRTCWSEEKGWKSSASGGSKAYAKLTAFLATLTERPEAPGRGLQQPAWTVLP